jgi:hypothetical protein
VHGPSCHSTGIAYTPPLSNALLWLRLWFHHRFCHIGQVVQALRADVEIPGHRPMWRNLGECSHLAGVTGALEAVKPPASCWSE